MATRRSARLAGNPAGNQTGVTQASRNEQEHGSEDERNSQSPLFVPQDGASDHEDDDGTDYEGGDGSDHDGDDTDDGNDLGELEDISPEELQNLPHHVEYGRAMLHRVPRQLLHMAVYRLVTDEKFRGRNRHLSEAEYDGLLSWPAVWPQESPVFSPYPRERTGYSNCGKTKQSEVFYVWIADYTTQ